MPSDRCQHPETLGPERANQPSAEAALPTRCSRELGAEPRTQGDLGKALPAYCSPAVWLGRALPDGCLVSSSVNWCCSHGVVSKPCKHAGIGAGSFLFPGAGKLQGPCHTGCLAWAWRGALWMLVSVQSS